MSDLNGLTADDRARITRMNEALMAGLRDIAFSEVETRERRRKAQNALDSLTSTGGGEQSLRSLREGPAGGPYGSHRGDAAIAQQISYDGGSKGRHA